MKCIYIVLILVAVRFTLSAQEAVTVAFYNVENLMDTLDNRQKLDNDFLPQGKYQWNTERYRKKITSMASVIAKLGDDNGPELLGLAEVENKNVLKDLVASAELKKHRYTIVHYDSPDERGIDVALLFKGSVFTYISSKKYSTSFQKIQSHTRDLLLVKGVLARKDTLFILVNHWPSRRKGTKETEDKRIAVALMVREVIDSIYQRSPKANIIVMGDFNDEPVDKSITIGLNTIDEQSKVNNEVLYNPFVALKKAGEGSVNYSRSWNMFDQIMISKNLLTNKKGFSYTQAAVYHPDWMHYMKDKKNGPFRTFKGNDYKGGYSDHFPVYIQLGR